MRLAPQDFSSYRRRSLTSFHFARNDKVKAFGKRDKKKYVPYFFANAQE
jgi:hypothetical protein